MFNFTLLPKHITLKILFELSVQEIIVMAGISKFFKSLLTLENIDQNYKLFTGKEFNWALYLLAKYPKLTLFCPEKNPNIDVYELYKQYPKRSGLQINDIRTHPSYTWERMKKEERYFKTIIALNPNITWDIVRDNPNVHGGWCYDFLCANPNITWDIIRDNPNIFQSECQIPRNPNIKLEHIIENPNMWNYSWLSLNRHVTFEYVMANPTVPGGWNYEYLLKHVTWEQAQYIKKKYNIVHFYYFVSQNPNITWENVVEDMASEDYDPEDDGWKMDGLSKNPNITWDIVRDNPNFGDERWDYIKLSWNKNITWDIIRANPNLPNSRTWHYSIFPKEVAFELRSNPSFWKIFCQESIKNNAGSYRFI